MNKSFVVTARIDPAMSEQLDALAKDFNRSRAWIVSQAIGRFVVEESDLIAAIREGEADIEAGRVHTQEQVEQMFGVGRGERDAA